MPLLEQTTPGCLPASIDSLKLVAVTGAAAACATECLGSTSALVARWSPGARST